MNFVGAKTASPWAVALVLILSGCVSAESSQKKEQSEPAPAPPAAPTTDAGSIQGAVTDDALQPVANAQLLLQEAEMTAVTDAAGAFTFNGVAPGSYSLFAAALGYESASKRVEVKAGEVAQVSFALAPLPVVEPYRELFHFRGFFGCSWRVVVATGPCFFPGPDVNPALFPQQNRAFFYNVWPNWRTLQGELVWKQNTLATGGTLSMTLSYQNRTTSHWWSNVEGPPPVLKQRCERTAEEWLGCNGGNQLPSGQPREIPNDKSTYIREFVNTGNAQVGGQTVPGFGMAFQQPIELWASVFYWEGASETYTAVPDQ